VRDLRKQYGPTVAVDGVSFEVSRNEIVGLLGPNGAGKTTTIECIIGLRRPDSGSIRVCGLDAIGDAEHVKARIGCQLQATALQDKITPRQALALFAAFYSHPADPQSLLQRFDLTEKADARYETLSGGQRQRVALALAFVNQPEILFLDEPTAGVDPEARRALHDLIRQFRQQGLTVIMTTHHIDEAESLCDRLAIINHGRIIALGSPAELTAQVSVPSRIIFRPLQSLSAANLADLGKCGEVTETADGWQISTASVSRTLTSLIGLLAAAGNEIAELRVRHATLDDAYLRFLRGG